MNDRQPIQRKQLLHNPNTIKTAFDLGFKSHIRFRTGDAADYDCPYTPSTPEWFAWWEGVHQSWKVLLKTMGHN